MCFMRSSCVGSTRESPVQGRPTRHRPAGSGLPSWNTVTLLSKPMPTRTQLGDPKRRCGAGYRPLPKLCLGVASFVALTCGFQANGVAKPIQQPKGNAIIAGTVVDE